MTELTTPTSVISLNTDIGEGYGTWRIADDEALLKLVSDANLACGFHASDPDIMRNTCRRVRTLGVAVGAQVGFHDILGFGRRYIDMPPSSLHNDVLYQLGALEAFARVEGTPTSFVKIHGALYHACLTREDYAAAVLDAVASFDPALAMMLQPNTALSRMAGERGLAQIREGYIDRAYTEDGQLVPRGTPGALITDPTEASARAVAMATQGTVNTLHGNTIAIPVDSICIHSDSPDAVKIATAVTTALRDSGVELVAAVRARELRQ